MSKFLTNDELQGVISDLKETYRVMSPMYERMGGRFAHTDNLIYDEIESFSDIVWKEKSHFSPKEVVFPITETLFWLDGNELRESKVDPRPVVLFLRACDINALKSLDHMFLKNGGNEDFYYKRLREKLKLVLIECESSFENCFCVSMNANTTTNFAASIRFSSGGGADVVTQDEAFAKYLAKVGIESNHKTGFVQENHVKVRTPDQICGDPIKVREILTGNPIWNEYDSRCIGCGRCTTSCPTCSCYSVFDVVYNQEAKMGERRRQHASCMTGNFTDMAGGHQFRQKTGERLRYRALHKVNDFKARQGEHHMCVGCGRCDDRCPHYISFSNIINKMSDQIELTLKNEAENVPV
ncbi:anaerobic sulfite reductase subunit AsrA [Vibrio crassostreae]|uniref:anaerobic sulfite reductase subunit AsrA n=1 Tax=Vibrio crassostreae TaxID=246167 RepID=UPI00200AC71B|nr:anaerobic sulfite reductase subunit AsrA [Vibrio crassostreae]UPR29064.1 anaerobic sulfite reductase subunit AsrA [Vibrio crassostreae]